MDKGSVSFPEFFTVSIKSSDNLEHKEKEVIMEEYLDFYSNKQSCIQCSKLLRQSIFWDTYMKLKDFDQMTSKDFREYLKLLSEALKEEHEQFHVEELF